MPNKQEQMAVLDAVLGDVRTSVAGGEGGQPVSDVDSGNQVYCPVCGETIKLVPDDGKPV